MELLIKKQTGQIAYCSTQKIYFVEFGNLLFKFTKNELIQFGDYVSKVDYKYWLENNKDCFNTRKLLLDIGTKHCGFALHVSELNELLELLNKALKKIEIQKNKLYYQGVCLN